MKRFPTKRIVTKRSIFSVNTQILKIFLLLFFVTLSQINATTNTLANQQQEIKGTVKDSDNFPLSGVNIIVKGTTTGTQSDFDGNYTIKARKGDVLQFSFIGMKTVSVTVGSSNRINITMEDDANALEEIVIVGYGSQKKTNVTGSISSVKAEDLVSIPTTNAVQALQGRATGVSIINGGSPGASPTVRIRGIGTLGDNTPTYVVDDVITSDISSLSANDIESISVLKDASTTAVYGSLGANGVIVIKTKKGKRGKTMLGFNSYVGTQFKPKKQDLLNSEQYVSYISDMILNADPNAALPVRFSDTNFIRNDVDYQEAIFQTGLTSNYELVASGGTKNATFRLSGGYQKQDGVLINTSLDKYNTRLSSSVSKSIFELGENFSFTYRQQNPLINANSVSPIENAFKMAPYLPIYDANNIGGYGELTGDDGNTTRNPVRNLNRETQLNKNLNVLGNLYGKAHLTKDLEYKINLGVYFSDNKFKKVELPYGSGGSLYNQGNTRLTYFDSRGKTITLTNSLKYKKTLNENHNFEFLVLSETNKTKRTLLRGQGVTEFGIEDLPSGLSGGATYSEFNKVGYLGRINYNFAGKYILAASLRADASSRFGSNNRWGNFPAFAAGWVISKEGFYGNENVMNYLKLRGSWGLSGNDKSAGNYGYESVLIANFFNGNVPGLAVSSVPNPDLKWEETSALNIGFDFGFLNDKITLTTEYYKNTSNDLIVFTPAADSAGSPNPTPKNIGGMTSKGFEFNLGYKERSKEFKWSANFNLSTTDNEVTKLADNVEQIFNGQKPNVLADGTISRIAEGEALWHFYGYQTDGIFQSQAEVDAHATQANAAPGDIRFKDINGDGIINDEDRTVIGNPFPKITYGLSLDADYKNFDLSLLFSGVSGNDVFNATRYYLDGAAQLTNAGTAVLDRWTPTNPSTTQPRAIVGDPNQNTRVSDRYVEDGSYFRLKNISLGYSMPQTSLQSLVGGTISKLRIYISAQNIFTATKYTGFDPELGPSLNIGSVNGDVNSELGVDRGQYPQPKSIIMGIQIKL